MEITDAKEARTQFDARMEIEFLSQWKTMLEKADKICTGWIPGFNTLVDHSESGEVCFTETDNDLCFLEKDGIVTIDEWRSTIDEWRSIKNLEMLKGKMRNIKTTAIKKHSDTLIEMIAKFLLMKILESKNYEVIAELYMLSTEKNSYGLRIIAKF